MADAAAEMLENLAPRFKGPLSDFEEKQFVKAAIASGDPVNFYNRMANPSELEAWRKGAPRPKLGERVKRKRSSKETGQPTPARLSLIGRGPVPTEQGAESLDTAEIRRLLKQSVAPEAKTKRLSLFPKSAHAGAGMEIPEQPLGGSVWFPNVEALKAQGLLSEDDSPIWSLAKRYMLVRIGIGGAVVTPGAEVIPAGGLIKGINSSTRVLKNIEFVPKHRMLQPAFGSRRGGINIPPKRGGHLAGYEPVVKLKTIKEGKKALEKPAVATTEVRDLKGSQPTAAQPEGAIGRWSGTRNKIRAWIENNVLLDPDDPFFLSEAQRIALKKAKTDPVLDAVTLNPEKMRVAFFEEAKKLNQKRIAAGKAPVELGNLNRNDVYHWVMRKRGHRSPKAAPKSYTGWRLDRPKWKEEDVVIDTIFKELKTMRKSFPRSRKIIDWFVGKKPEAIKKWLSKHASSPTEAMKKSMTGAPPKEGQKVLQAGVKPEPVKVAPPEPAKVAVAPKKVKELTHEEAIRGFEPQAPPKPKPAATGSLKVKRAKKASTSMGPELTRAEIIKKAKKDVDEAGGVFSRRLTEKTEALRINSGDEAANLYETTGRARMDEAVKRRLKKTKKPKPLKFPGSREDWFPTE